LERDATSQLGPPDGAASEAALAGAAHGPVGVAGWLALPILGLVLSPFRAVIDIVHELQGGDGAVLTIGQVLSGGHFQAATLLQLLNFSGVRGGLTFALDAIVAVLSITLSFIAPIVLLILAYRRSIWFPRGMVLYLAVDLLFQASVWALAGYGLMPGTHALLATVLSSALRSSIWIGYFLRSQRVRNTFVT
jgi:Protein of unknown function (DUF2569)